MITTNRDLDPRIKTYFEDQEELRKRLESPEYQANVGASRLQDLDAARKQQEFAGYAKGLAQIGSLRGQVADTSAVQQAADTYGQQQQALQKGMAEDEDRLDRQTGLRLKTLSYLQDREDKKREGEQRDELARESAKQRDRERREDYAFKDRLFAKEQASQKQRDEERFSREQERLAGESQVRRDVENQRFQNDMKLAQAKTTQESKIPNKEQFDAATYGKRMEQADQILDSLADQGFNRASFSEGVKSALIPNALRGDQFKSQEQAERNFINAVLRRESGAAISPAEFENAQLQYFPRAGDTPAVLAQKKQNRMQGIEGLKSASGNAWTRVADVPLPSLEENQSSGTAYAAEAPSSPKEGEEVDGYLYLGGDPSKPESWRKK